MVNKKWNDFSLNGAIGGSINSTNVNSLRLDSKTASLYYPNVFTVANIKMTQAAYIDEQMNQKRVLQSLFGTAQLGTWMLPHVTIGRRHWPIPSTAVSSIPR